MQILILSRRWVFAMLAAGTLAVSATPTTGHAQTSYSDLFYRRGTQMCLRPLADGSGNPFAQVACNANDPYQEWYLTYVGHQPIANHSGSYYLYFLINKKTQTCIGARNGSTATFTTLVQMFCDPYSPWVLWAVGTANGSPNFDTGYFELIGQQSGKCLTVPYPDSVGTYVILAPCTSGGGSANNYQLWHPPNRWP